MNFLLFFFCIRFHQLQVSIYFFFTLVFLLGGLFSVFFFSLSLFPLRIYSFLFSGFFFTGKNQEIKVIAFKLLFHLIAYQMKEKWTSGRIEKKANDDKRTKKKTNNNTKKTKRKKKKKNMSNDDENQLEYRESRKMRLKNYVWHR